MHNVMESTLFPKIKKNAGAPDSTTLFLSLYLVILAFFILLNSIAQINKEQSKQTVASVNKAFTSEKPTETFKKQEIQEPEGQEISLDAYFAQLSSHLEETIQIVDAKKDIAAGTMTLTIPADTLFLPKTATLNSNKKSTLEKIAASISPNKAGTFIEIEFLLHSAHFLKGESPSANMLIVNRAGTLARAMISLGVRKNLLSTGIENGNDGNIEVTFRVRIKEDAINKLQLK